MTPKKTTPNIITTQDYSIREDDLEAVRKVASFIREHLQDNPGLPDLARNVFMSPSKLKTLFKRATGMTISEYRARERISLACHLLESTHLPVRQIADRCGYRKLDNFNILFQKRMNMTPRQFRDSVQAPH